MEIVNVKKYIWYVNSKFTDELEHSAFSRSWDQTSPSFHSMSKEIQKYEMDTLCTSKIFEVFVI